MKPEPLKSLHDKCDDFLNCKPEVIFNGVTIQGFFIEEENIKEMIKSAVDWLKNEIPKHYNGVMTDRMNMLIDQAFEDVTK